MRRQVILITVKYYTHILFVYLDQNSVMSKFECSGWLVIHEKVGLAEHPIATVGPSIIVDSLSQMPHPLLSSTFQPFSDPE